ncbi:MAG: hypothetical protein ACJ8AW_05280 [Rhodopila sp.]
MNRDYNETAVSQAPIATRNEVVSLSSWQASVLAIRALTVGVDGRDTPGHDEEATDRCQFPPSQCQRRRLANPAVLVQFAGGADLQR